MIAVVDAGGVFAAVPLPVPTGWLAVVLKEVWSFPQKDKLDGHALVFQSLPLPDGVAVALEVTGRPVEPAQGQDHAAVVDVHVPPALAVGRAFADLRPSFQAHRPFVVADAAVQEAPASQLLDDPLLFGRRVRVVPEDAVPALTQVGHEVEA